MTTAAITAARADTQLLGIGFALLAGLGLLFFAGIAQGTVLHDVAHDKRHAVGFPCH